MDITIENVKDSQQSIDDIFWEDTPTQIYSGSFPYNETIASSPVEEKEDPLKVYLNKIEDFEMPSLVQITTEEDFVLPTILDDSAFEQPLFAFVDTEAHTVHRSAYKNCVSRLGFDHPVTQFFQDNGEKILYYFLSLPLSDIFLLNVGAPKISGGRYTEHDIQYSAPFAREAYTHFFREAPLGRNDQIEIIGNMNYKPIFHTHILNSVKNSRAAETRAERRRSKASAKAININDSAVYKTTFSGDSLGIVHEDSVARAAKSDSRKRVLMDIYREKKRLVKDKPYMMLVMNGAFKAVLNSDLSFMQPNIVKDLLSRADIVLHDGRVKQTRSNWPTEIFQDVPYIYGVPVDYNALVSMIWSKSKDKSIARKEIGLLYRWFVKSIPGSGYQLGTYIARKSPFWSKTSFVHKIALNYLPIRERALLDISLDYDHRVSPEITPLMTGFITLPNGSEEPEFARVKLADDISPRPLYVPEGNLCPILLEFIPPVTKRFVRNIPLIVTEAAERKVFKPTRRVVVTFVNESGIGDFISSNEVKEIIQACLALRAQCPDLLGITKLLVSLLVLYNSPNTAVTAVSVCSVLLVLLTDFPGLSDTAFAHKMQDAAKLQYIPESATELWDLAFYAASHLSVTSVLEKFGIFNSMGVSGFVSSLRSVVCHDKMYNFESFMRAIIAFIKALFSRLQECVEKKSLDPLFASRLLTYVEIDREVRFIASYDNAISYSEQIRKDFLADKRDGNKAIPDYILAPYTPPEAKERLEFLRDQLNALQNRSGTGSAMFSILHGLISTTLTKIVSKMSGATYRVPGFGIFIHGPPGCGKTMIIRNFTHACMKMHGREDANIDKMLYTKPLDTPFWDGVQPDVYTVLADDVDQMKVDLVSMKSLAEMWNSGCNAKPWRVAMASLEDKGMFISPKLIIQASNNSDGGMNAVMKETAIESNERRMKMRIRVQAKKEFSGTNGSVDMRKVKERNAKFEDCVEYWLSLYDPSDQSLRTEAKIVTFQELMSIFSREYRAHRLSSDPPPLPNISCLNCLQETCVGGCPQVQTLPEAETALVLFVAASVNYAFYNIFDLYWKAVKFLRDVGFFLRVVYFFFLLPFLFLFSVEALTFFPPALWTAARVFTVTTVPVYIMQVGEGVGPYYNLHTFLVDKIVKAYMRVPQRTWKRISLACAILAPTLLAISWYQKRRKINETPEMYVTNNQFVPIVREKVATPSMKEKLSFPWENHLPEYTIPCVTPSNLLESIHNRMVELHHLSTKSTLYGFCTSQFSILCPKHFFMPNGNFVSGEVKGAHEIQIRQGSKMITILVDKFYSHQDRDLVEFLTTNLNIFVPKNFKLEDHLLDDNDSWEAYANNKEAFLYNLNGKIPIEGRLSKSSRSVGGNSIISYNADTKNGDCTSVLVCGDKILGFHVARMEINATLLFRCADRYTKTSYKKAKTSLQDFGGSHPVVFPEGQYYDVLHNIARGQQVFNTVPLRSNLHVELALRVEAELDRPHLILFNQKGTVNSTFTSNFKPTPYYMNTELEEFFKRHGTTFTKFAPVEVIQVAATLEGRTLEGYCTPFSKNLIASCATSCDREVIADAAATFLDVEINDDRKLRPLTLSEIVSGNDYLNGSNNKSSAGFPYGKNKDIYVKYAGEKVEISLVVKEEFDNIIEILKTSTLYTPYVMRQIKDEVRTVEQIKKLKTRLFSVGKAPFLAACKAYLGPLAYIMQTHWKVFMNTLGYDLSDSKNREILQYLEYFANSSELDSEMEPVRRMAQYILALDAKNFDMVGDTLITFFIGLVIQTLLVKFGYTLEDAHIAWMCFLSSFYCVNEIKGDYYTSNHTLPSGMFHTFMYNCLKSALAYIIAYIRLVPKTLKTSRPYKGVFFSATSYPSFRGHVKALFGGDDALAKVSPIIAPYYDQQKIKKALVDVFDVQPEKKEQEMLSFITWEDSRFLKRFFSVIYHEGKSYCVSALEFDSMAKTLSYTDSSVADWDTKVPQDKLDNFVRELFHHGKEVFEEGLAIVLKIQAALSYPLSTHTFSSLAAKHRDGSMMSWTEGLVRPLKEEPLVRVKDHYFKFTMSTPIENEKSGSASDITKSSVTTTQITAEEFVKTTSVVPTASIDLQDDPMSLLLKTDVRVFSTTFATGDTLHGFTTTYPLRLYHNSSFIKNKLNNRHGIKGTYKITCRFIGNGMIKGGLAVAMFPRPFSDQSRSMNTVAYAPTYYTISQLDDVQMVDFSNLKDLVFYVGPHHLEAFTKINHTDTSHFAEHWTLYTCVMAQPTAVVVAGNTSVEMQVYVSLVDYSLAHIMPESKVSDSFKKVGTALKTVENIPYLGGAVNFLSKLSHAAGSVLDVFGFSKSIQQEVIPAYVYRKRISNVDTPDPAENLGLMSCSHAPFIAPDGSQDPLNINWLTSHPTLIYTALVSEAGPLNYIPCVPGNFPLTGTNSPIGWLSTVDAWIMNMFSRYRVEKMHFTFQFFSHPAFKGNVAIYYIPYVDTSLAYQPDWEVNCRKVIVSLEGSSSTTLTVNWCAQTHSLVWASQLNDTRTLDVASNGMFVVKVLNCVSPLTSDDSVRMVVFYESEGLDPIGLTDQTLGGLNEFGSKVLTVYAVESKFGPSFSRHDRVEINKPNPLDVAVMLASEKVVSLRTILQRPSILCSFSESGVEGNAPFYFRFNPLMASSSGMAQIAGGAAQTTTYTTYLAYITAGFVFHRGSIRASVITPETFLLRTYREGVGEPLQFNTMNVKPDLRVHILKTLRGKIPYSILEAKYSGNKPRFAKNCNSLAFEENERVSIPYSQPYPFVASNIFPDNPTNEAFDENWFDEYCYLTFTNYYDHSAGTDDLNVVSAVYLSGGDDFDVAIWRGVPRWTYSAESRSVGSFKNQHTLGRRGAQYVLFKI